jgi:hypothetical protein
LGWRSGKLQQRNVLAVHTQPICVHASLKACFHATTATACQAPAPASIQPQSRSGGKTCIARHVRHHPVLLRFAPRHGQDGSNGATRCTTNHRKGCIKVRAFLHSKLELGVYNSLIGYALQHGAEIKQAEKWLNK